MPSFMTTTLIFTIFVIAVLVIGAEERQKEASPPRTSSKIASFVKAAGAVSEQIHSLFPSWLGKSATPLQLHDHIQGKNAKTGARSVAMTRLVGMQASNARARRGASIFGRNGDDEEEDTEWAASSELHEDRLGKVLGNIFASPKNATSSTSSAPEEEKKSTDHIATGTLRRHFETMGYQAKPDYLSSVSPHQHENRDAFNHAARDQTPSTPELRRLREWRSLRRTHRAHSREMPRLPPEHLPPYLSHAGEQSLAAPHNKRRSALPPRSTLAAAGNRHGFHAQQLPSSTTGPDSQRTPFCQGGALAVRADSTFTCTFNATALSGQPGVAALSSGSRLQGSTYASLNATWRSQCKPDSSSRQCVCPFDSILTRTVLGDTLCLPKEVHCDVVMERPITNCEKIDSALATKVPVCLRVPRRSSIGITLNFSCEFAFANPVDYAFFGIEILNIPNTSLILLNASTAGSHAETLDPSQPAVAGNATEIAFSAFKYDASSKLSRLPMTVDHPLYKSGEYFYRGYNFRELSDDSVNQTTPVRSQSNGGRELTNGGSQVQFTLPMATMSDQFVSGGRFYFEAGIRSTSIRSRTRVSDGITAASLTVDFSDVAAPPPISRVNTNALAIGLGVSGGVLLLLVLVVFGVWYQRRQSRKSRKEEQEEEEQLDAQERKKKKDQ